VYELSKQLVKHGHEVTVFTGDVCGKQNLAVKQHRAVYVDGIETYYFRNVLNWLMRNAKFATPYRLPAIARREIERFDIIHLHEHRTAFAAILHHYAIKHRIPYIVHSRGSVLQETVLRDIRKQKLKQLFDSVWGDQILRDATKLIALTKTEELEYLRMGVPQDKVEIVPNGINCADYKKLPAKGEFRKKHAIDPQDRVVLSLGRIHEVKGIDLLVASFAELVKVMKDIKLVIAGPDRGFRSTLENQVERLGIGEYVKFVGPIYESDKIEAYVDADVFVLPSRYEPFGVVILEASACGTPVIVTTRCLFADGVAEFGLVVEYDVKQMKDALFALLSDDQLRQRLGQRGRVMMRDKFDYPKIAEQVVSVYESALKRPVGKIS
jgi:glycosyltransferase involved in cell wall biosynthesis